jgi:hypothetical protein
MTLHLRAIIKRHAGVAAVVAALEQGCGPTPFELLKKYSGRKPPVDPHDRARGRKIPALFFSTGTRGARTERHEPRKDQLGEKLTNRHVLAVPPALR